MMAQWSLGDLNRASPSSTVPTLFIHGENDSAGLIRVAEKA
jgi:pimeloyl-ACP methyl ester carboxylesterase